MPDAGLVWIRHLVWTDSLCLCFEPVLGVIASLSLPRHRMADRGPITGRHRVMLMNRHRLLVSRAASLSRNVGAAIRPCLQRRLPTITSGVDTQRHPPEKVLPPTRDTRQRHACRCDPPISPTQHPTSISSSLVRLAWGLSVRTFQTGGSEVRWTGMMRQYRQPGGAVSSARPSPSAAPSSPARYSSLSLSTETSPLRVRSRVACVPSLLPTSPTMDPNTLA